MTLECSVTVEIHGTRILLVCAYMSCDDNRPNHNIMDFNIVIKDIKTICNSVNVQLVILGGDFNTDLRRSYYFTTAFNEYINDELMYPCIKSDCSTEQCTYCSKGSNSRSLIDHFVISENLQDDLSSYDEIDSHDNFLDHITFKFVLNVNVIYCHRSATVQENITLPAWSKLTNGQIIAYQSVLNDKLNNIITPYAKMCKVHHSEICEYHDAVIMSMIDACRETIPTTKPANKFKTIPGWNDYVKGYFDTSLFWHNMWVENDKPHNGIVADLMRQTRAKYHHVLIYSYRRLSVYLSLLFTTVLRHGLTPDGMLNGTMVPIPKRERSKSVIIRQWKSLS